jgi:small subunit ribosomal protein S1
VMVIIKRLDWERDRISLSLRETIENPWDKVTMRYPVGSIHHGRVSRLTAFGAFVTLDPGIDGLLHISKLGAGRRIHHPREVLETGQELTIKIESVDTNQKRLALTPEDYVAKEPTEEYIPPPAAKEAPSMGTLGDLMASQMKKKKR